MAERSFAPVDVSDDILDRFRKLPVATTWAAVANLAGVPLPFMEGVRNFTPRQTPRRPRPHSPISTATSRPRR